MLDVAHAQHCHGDYTVWVAPSNIIYSPVTNCWTVGPDLPRKNYKSRELYSSCETYRYDEQDKAWTSARSLPKEPG